MKLLKVKDRLNRRSLDSILQAVYRLKARLNESERLVTNLVGEDRERARDIVGNIESALKGCLHDLKNWKKQVK